MQLKNKVVFITGGAQGFGRGVSEAVLKKGGKVCITDVKAEEGEQTASELGSSYGQDNVMFVQCDVTNAAVFEGAFKSAVAKFGQIDVMCNNAGILNEKIWEKQIAINFTAVVRGTMLAIDHMRKDKGGKGGVIINTASLAAVNPTYWHPVYAGTKSAVQNFTNSWALFAEYGISPRVPDLLGTTLNNARTALMNMVEGQIINLPHYKQTMGQKGYCTVEQVVEAFLKAMEDDSLNGVLLTVREKEGVTCKKLTLVPVDQPPAE